MTTRSTSRQYYHLFPDVAAAQGRVSAMYTQMTQHGIDYANRPGGDLGSAVAKFRQTARLAAQQDINYWSQAQRPSRDVLPAPHPEK